MAFLLSAELEEFANTLASFLNEKLPTESLHQRTLDMSKTAMTAAACRESEFWKSISALGIFAAGIEEDYQGLGLNITALNIICQVLGANLGAYPTIENIIFGADLLGQLAAKKHKADLQTKIAAGHMICTAASQHLYLKHKNPLKISFASNKQTAKLSGELDFVPYYETADLLLIPLAEPAILLGIKLGQIKSITFQRLDSIDLFRPYYRLTLDHTEADILSEEISVELVQNAALRLSNLAASEMVGSASQTLRMSCEYAKTRKQFGKSIGSFQAVAHKLANMQVKVASAEALVRFALWASAEDKESFPAAALAASCFCSGEMPVVCEDSIQAHGGIGFTFEYALHFYLRRVRALATLFGSSSDAACDLAKLRTK